MPWSGGFGRRFLFEGTPDVRPCPLGHFRRYALLTILRPLLRPPFPRRYALMTTSRRDRSSGRCRIRVKRKNRPCAVRKLARGFALTSDERIRKSRYCERSRLYRRHASWAPLPLTNVEGPEPSPTRELSRCRNQPASKNGDLSSKREVRHYRAAGRSRCPARKARESASRDLANSLHFLPLCPTPVINAWEKRVVARRL